MTKTQLALALQPSDCTLQANSNRWLWPLTLFKRSCNIISSMIAPTGWPLHECPYNVPIIYSWFLFRAPLWCQCSLSGTSLDSCVNYEAGKETAACFSDHIPGFLLQEVLYKPITICINMPLGLYFQACYIYFLRIILHHCTWHLSSHKHGRKNMWFYSGLLCTVHTRAS